MSMHIYVYDFYLFRLVLIFDRAALQKYCLGQFACVCISVFHVNKNGVVSSETMFG